MSKQPEALRLADELYVGDFDYLTNHGAAEELRRLHALCEEMGEALETTDRWLGADDYAEDGATRRFIRTVLAKWKESK